MKIDKTLARLLVLYFFILSFTASCKKDDQEPEYSYFVSKELALSFDQNYINSIIGPLSVQIPEVSVFSSLVMSDIKIYKIVYKTTVDDKAINASGLVCVPSEQGDYPVISFQNGTNTLNANAPSKSAFNFQLIGLIASMGYVVVVPDYPGFGESSDVPHPYLVKEPMVQSLVDMLHAVNELPGREFPGLTIKNEYYLLGYSLGGWSSLALHKELELNFSDDFNLEGSMCGAGPYDIELLLENMVDKTIYNYPVYIAYILNAYSAYHQFTNPVSDILNEPYATRVSSLFNGLLGMGQINAQLNDTINRLITPGFLSGFETSQQYTSVREALVRNSISAWDTNTPLLLVHGSDDSQVDIVSTENIYTQMINTGTSSDIIKKVIVPGDHGDAAVPAIILGIRFIQDLQALN